MGQSAFGAFLKAFVLWLLAIVVRLMGLESKAVRKAKCSTWPIRPLEMAA
jgi:hypothetical protein